MKRALLLFSTYIFLLAFPPKGPAQSERLHTDMKKATQLYMDQQYEAAWKIVQAIDTTSLFKEDPWKIRYWWIAGGCHFNQDNAEAAQRIYEQVVETDWTNPALQDTFSMKLLFDTGNYFRVMRNVPKSMMCFDLGEKMSKKLYGPSSADWTRFQMKKASALHDIENDYASAITLANHALAVWVKKHGKWNAVALGYYKTLARIESKGPNPLRAIKIAQEHMTISNKINTGKRLANVYFSWNLIADVHRQMDEYDKAIAAHSKALAVAIQMGDLGNQRKQLESWGFNLYYQKKYAEAEIHFKKAYKLYVAEYGELSTKALTKTTPILACMTELKRYAEADQLIKSLIEKSGYDPGTHVSFQKLYIDKVTLIQILYFDAKNQYYWFLEDGDERKLKDACRQFDNAVAMLEDLHQEYEEAGSQQYLLNLYHYVFEMSLNALFDLYQCTGSEEVLAQAFGCTERSRALFLSETLKRSDAGAAATIPDSLRKALQKEQRKLAEVENKHYQLLQKYARDAPEVLDVYEKIYEIKQRIKQLETEARRLNPAYSHAKDVTWVQPEQIRKRLKPGEGWLSYFAGEDDMYAFLITAEGSFFYHIPKDFPLEKWVEEMRNAVYDYPLERNDSLLSVYRTKAWQLYEKLLAPFAWRLPPRLTIGADGVLKYLPFEALLSAPTEDCESSECPYLLRKHSISYAPSATLWATDRKRNDVRLEKKILAFAPEFQGEQSALAARDERRSSLGPLLYNAVEAKSIGKLFRTKIIKGSEATRDAFLAQAARYQVLHLATHAKANDEEGEFSFLAFAPTPGDTLYEGKLYVRELYATSLPAELVVLSACETGMGEFKRGEGLVSLAYGFTQAGVRSVVTSLWRVSDRETAELMEFFYQNLRKGQTKDEALRQAKLQYMQGQSDWRAHPFFWAAFVPEGDMSPLDLPRPMPVWAWVAVAALLLAGTWWWKGFRIQRRTA